MRSRLCLLTAAVLLMITQVPFASSQAPATPAQELQYKPGMKMSSLQGHSGSEVIVYPNGRRVTVDQMRKVQQAVQMLQAHRVHQEFPMALRTKPALTGTRLAAAADIADALRRNQPTETLQLPSGHTITTGQLRLLQSEIEARTGRKLEEIPARPSLSGPHFTIKPQTDKKALQLQLKNLKDSDVLESPNHHVVTAGEVRQFLNTLPSPPSANSVPVSARPIGGVK